MTAPRRRQLASIVLAGLFGIAPAARAADFTYGGTGRAVGQGFQGAWSEPSNWAGGTAPSGSVGTLVFPPTSACNAATQDPNRCVTTDDVHGLSVNAIKLEADYEVDGVSGCFGPCPTPGGDPLTLGSGGLTARESPSDGGYPYFAPAIILGAPQTWSIVGNHSGAGLQVASVTGASKPLAIAFSNLCRGRLKALCDPFVDIAAGAEVGAITVTGHGTVEPVGAPFSLNATDGNPVAITGGAGLGIGFDSTVGPLTFTNGFLQLGTQNGAAILNGTGSVSLDSKSGVTLFIRRAGTSPGRDFASLHAHGPVSLVGAHLYLSGPGSGPYCPHLHRADVDTLIATTGVRSGQFTSDRPIAIGIGRYKFVSFNVRNGTTLPVNCDAAAPNWNWAHAPRVRINYTQHGVTATVIGVRPTR